MFKKSLSLLYILCLCSLLFASTQKLYIQDSEEIKLLDYLLIKQNYNSIPKSYPIAEEVLSTNLSKINISDLEQQDLRIYEKLKSKLNEKANVYDNGHNSLNVDGTLAFNLKSTLSKEPIKNYEYRYIDEKPWFDIKAQINFNEYIFGYGQFVVQAINPNPTGNQPKVYTNLKSTILDKDFATNFQHYQPFQTGLSIGLEGFNFQIGRNHVSEGSGISGNLVIGDNFVKQDYTKLSLYSPLFDYNLSLTMFDQQYDNVTFKNISFNNLHQYRVMHTLCFKIANNFTVSLYQGGIYNTNHFDFRMIMPFMYVHNYFNYDSSKVVKESDEGNNILAAQMKYTLNKELEISFQVILDQIQVPAFGETDNTFPNAYGLLFNVKKTNMIKQGLWSSFFEVVYTSPYLYLNDKESKDGNKEYNLDYIVGNDYGSNDEIGYSGYIFGPDNFIINIGTQLDNLNNMTLGFDFMFRIKGEKGIDFENKGDGRDIISDTISRSFISGIKEVSFTYKPYIKCKITDSIEFNGSTVFSQTINRYNIKNNNNMFALQTGIYFKWTAY